MPPLTRGPLPARVYWVRRLSVLGIALLLVVGIARLLGSGSDGSSGEDQAAQVASGVSSSPATSPDDSLSTSVLPSTPSGKGTHTGKSQKASEQPTLAVPQGACAGSDIAVTPKVTNAVAGRDVMLVLQLRTITSEACTWQVSPSTLTVKITSGTDAIWSSAQCPKAIPVRDVVVRRAVTTDVGVIWKSAGRWNSTCSLLTDWAKTGYYHVTASSLAGEPSDAQFQLVAPTSITVTKTAAPTESPSSSPTGQASGQPTGHPTGSASVRPSGQPTSSRAPD